MDGWMDGWMPGLFDGWMDGRMPERRAHHVYTYKTVHTRLAKLTHPTQPVLGGGGWHKWWWPWPALGLALWCVFVMDFKLDIITLSKVSRGGEGRGVPAYQFDQLAGYIPCLDS